MIAMMIREEKGFEVMMITLAGAGNLSRRLACGTASFPRPIDLIYRLGIIGSMIKFSVVAVVVVKTPLREGGNLV